MTTIARIALLGFSRFERATFESFFRLAAKRTPSYAHVADLDEADYIVADADDPALTAQLQDADLRSRCVILGATDHPGVLMRLPRPINLMLVVRALDGLPRRQPMLPPGEAAQRVLQDLGRLTAAGSPVRAALAPAEPSRVPSASPASTPAPAVARQPAATPSSPASPPAPPAAASQAPARPPQAAPAEQAEPSSGGAAQDHILVVDDSDIALRFMAGNLQRFGFQIHLARSGQEAIERVAQRHFEFVFLDVMMEGLDGFQTCKAIKRSTYPDRRPPPTVVMLTSRGTTIEKLRGTMAGCDAYLTKPLREGELLKVVGDREIAQHAYAETAAYANTTL
jgi:two-component system, cell cycle response regulator